MGVKQIPQALGLHIGDKVELDAQQGRLVVAPVARIKYSLNELLAIQGNKPLAIDREWDTMPAVGKEAPQ